MDIWINHMHDSKLASNYMRIDLLYGFYLVVMYFIINYMRLCHASTRKGSTRGNCRVPLNGFQFLENQPKARKVFGILTRLKNRNLT